MNEITKELLEQLKWLVDHASQHGIMPASLSKSRKAIAKAEAALAKPQAGKWIPWKGGDCPVEHNTHVNVRNKSGEHTGKGWEFDWNVPAEEYKITAYRIVNP